MTEAGMQIHGNVRRIGRVLLGMVLLLAALQPTQAQTWPDRPLRVLVGFGAGGSTDIFGRLLQPVVSRALGQPVIIDNRPGAGTTIAGALLTKSAPDGYTAMLATSDLVANAHLIANLPYDTLKDLQPVATLVRLPLAWVVHPSMPATLTEFVAHARARPGQLSYASPGIGSPNHLYAAIFMGIAGIDIVHVPYKSGAQAITDLTSGQVQASLISTAQAAPHSRTGKLKVLAVAAGGGKRAPMLAHVPTFVESGYAAFEPGFWIGLVVPAGTPAAVVQRLNAEFSKALRAPELDARMSELGMEIVAGSPAEMAELLRSDYESLGRIIRERNITVN